MNAEFFTRVTDRIESIDSVLQSLSQIPQSETTAKMVADLNWQKNLLCEVQEQLFDAAGYEYVISDIAPKIGLPEKMLNSIMGNVQEARRTRNQLYNDICSHIFNVSSNNTAPQQQSAQAFSTAQQQPKPQQTMPSIKHSEPPVQPPSPQDVQQNEQPQVIPQTPQQEVVQEQPKDEPEQSSPQSQEPVFAEAVRATTPKKRQKEIKTETQVIMGGKYKATNFDTSKWGELDKDEQKKIGGFVQNLANGKLSKDEFEALDTLATKGEVKIEKLGISDDILRSLSDKDVVLFPTENEAVLSFYGLWTYALLTRKTPVTFVRQKDKLPAYL